MEQSRHEQAAYWLIRIDADNLSASEKERFQSWLTEKPEHQEAFDEAAALWAKMDTVQEASAAQGNAGSIRDIACQQPPARKTQYRPVALAALIAGIITLTAVHLDLPILLLADHTTSVGETRIIRLPDGSTAHLNTGSAIQVSFSNDARNIALLKGEASFKVQPERLSPFRVTANGGIITALGTAFTVRLKDDRAIVTVSEHSVSVALEGVKAPRPIILKEKESVSFDESALLGNVRTVTIQNTLAWKTGRLVFKDTPLSSVIGELNRYHSGHIRIVDREIGNIRVNGVFDLTKPGTAIAILEKSLNLRAIRLTNYLILLTG